MNKKQKEEQYKIFAEAFHDVVPPLIEDLTSKDDLNRAVDRIERKLDKIDSRLDRQGKMLDNHEKKIKKIINRLSITSA